MNNALTSAAWLCPLNNKAGRQSVVFSASGNIDEDMAFASNMLPISLKLQMPDQRGGESDCDELQFFYAVQEVVDELLDAGHPVLAIAAALRAPKYTIDQADAIGYAVHCVHFGTSSAYGLDLSRATELCQMQARIMAREIVAEREHPAMYGVSR